VGHEPNKKWIKSFENQRSMAKLCHGWNFKSPNDNNFGTIAIDKNGTKWLSTNSDGVVGFNESTNTFKKITAGSDTGNLPSQMLEPLQ
jgi:hypothetical protein